MREFWLLYRQWILLLLTAAVPVAIAGMNGWFAAAEDGLPIVNDEMARLLDETFAPEATPADSAASGKLPADEFSASSSDSAKTAGASASAPTTESGTSAGESASTSSPDSGQTIVRDSVPTSSPTEPLPSREPDPAPAQLPADTAPTEGESAANSPRVNLNTATLEQLMTLPGIGESKGKAIIEYRMRTGGFRTKREITNVKGIGEKTYEKLQDLIAVE